MLTNNFIHKYHFSFLFTGKPILFILVALICLPGTSCKKFLDKKQNKSTATVSSGIEYLQYLLDANFIMNVRPTGTPVIASDEYYLPFTTWASSNVADQGIYVWDKNASPSGWNYKAIYVTNVVLEELDKIDRNTANQLSYDNIRGQALFFRSYAFHDLAQIYCRPYSVTASTDPGIVLRLTSDFNVKLVRSTVQETYDRILTDLKEAADLLPETNIAISRPNKCAAYAALARVCLSMRDYANAGRYADLSLKRNSALMDYNTLDSTLALPISEFNPENIFLSYIAPGASSVATPRSNTPVDTLLYRSYASNDLRKAIFFQPIGTDHYFKGYYGNTLQGQFFCGLATDEMYLIRAECAARAGDKDSAMADLNRLLLKRWKTGTFIPFTATSTTDAINQIIAERKKELIYRNLRWSDLRRLNLEGANITLTRILNGVIYTLPPNDLRWVFLIPPDVISLNGMQQNPR